MLDRHALPVGRGLFFIAFAAIAWGAGGFVAAILYRDSGLGPIAVSFWRFVGGMALLAALRPMVSQHRAWRAGAGRLALTGVGFALYQTAYYAAIDLAGLAIGTVVTLGSGPVLIALGARAFGERLGRAGTATVAASVAGLALLVADDQRSGSNPALGILVALLSAAGYAGVTLLTRAASDDPYDSALGGFVVGGVCLLPLAALEGLLPDRYSADVLSSLAFLGAVPTAMAYAMFFAGLRVVRATTASVVALVEPLAAAGLAVALLGERLTLTAGAGAALLLSAVGVLAVHERRRRITTREGRRGHHDAGHHDAGHHDAGHHDAGGHHDASDARERRSPAGQGTNCQS